MKNALYFALERVTFCYLRVEDEQGGSAVKELLISGDKEDRLASKKGDGFRALYHRRDAEDAEVAQRVDGCSFDLLRLRRAVPQ